LNRDIPEAIVISSNRKKPWYDKELKKVNKKKTIARAKYLYDASSLNKQNYDSLNKHYRRNIRTKNWPTTKT